MKKEDHPFYCHKKHCRKTAWETPEYLSKEDWNLVERVIIALETGSQALIDFLNSITPQEQLNFFHHILGWPEGYIYCQNFTYVKKTAFQGIVKHDLSKLKESLKNKP